jgi:hypothetical protein
VPTDEPPPGPYDAFRRLSEQMAGMNEGIRRAFEPEVAKAMNRLTEQVHQQTEGLQRALASVVAPSFEKWSLQLPKIGTDWVEQMRPIFERLRRAWQDALPPNWEGFEPEEVTAAIERIGNTGYCLVWLPRIEIVREVMAAEEAATKEVLLKRRDEVLDDAVTVLAGVVEPELALERDAANAAVGAFRDGHWMAAQALASSVFTSAAHETFEMGTGAIGKRMAEKHPNEAGLAQLRLTTIYLAATHALAVFRPDKGYPVRSDFNRHNTAHRITAEQWTEANALSAVMLSTAFLRELNFWYARQRVAAENGNPET